MSFLFNANHSNSNNSYNGTGSFNQTGNQTYSGTSTPTNPDWVTHLAGTLGNNLTSINGTNPQSYVAGAAPLQNEAASNASWLGRDPSGWYQAYNTAQGAGNTSGLENLANQNPDTATALMMKNLPQVTAQTGAQNMGQYMSPYLNDVVNSSLAGFDNQAGQTRAQDDLALAGSGAFGGSGAAIQKALTEGQLGLARGQLQSGLLNQGFNTAAALGQQDAGLNLAAQQTNAGNELARQESNQGAADQISLANIQNQIANKGLNSNIYSNALQQQLASALGYGNLLGAHDATAQGNAVTQANIGSGMRDITQQQQTAPLALQQYLTSLFSGLPLGLFNGQTQSGNSTSNTSGTQTQSGTSTGSNSSTGFNFGLKLGQ